MGYKARNKQKPPQPLEQNKPQKKKNNRSNKKQPEAKRKRVAEEQIVQPKKQKVVAKSKKPQKAVEPEFGSEEEGTPFLEGADDGDDLWDNAEPASEEDDNDEFDADVLDSDGEPVFPKADVDFLGGSDDDDEGLGAMEDDDEEEDDSDMDEDELAEFEGLDERKSRKIEARKARDAALAEAELRDAALQTNLMEEVEHYKLPEDEEEAVADVTAVNQRIQEVVNILNNFKTLRDPTK